MKRFIAQLNDGSFINVAADRMELHENGLLVWDGEKLVAYVDLIAAVCAHLSERGTEKCQT